MDGLLDPKNDWAFKLVFDQLKDGIEKWAYFFKHASHIDPEDLDKVLKEDSVLSNEYKALGRLTLQNNSLITIATRGKKKKSKLEQTMLDWLEKKLEKKRPS